ncbi:MAG TPA: HD domain-containing phosphohydrolase [Tepidisphaeraceae bacterium]|jgi:HD-GYP domain-containing protein (c-di-GMP phosphodiesterase class II)|nr:HD domain-containing phosphohydrolase [Tepidisphaeraceae bacterium]
MNAVPIEALLQEADPTLIRLSEVIASLSYALDLTGGQPQGHASRSCLFGMRIAQQLRLPVAESSALFYGLLLKDLGCSTNASKMCYLFGADDHVTKMASKTVDIASVGPRLGYIARNVAPGGSILQKATQLTKVAMAGLNIGRELIEMRCERGAKIARDLHLPDATAVAIRALDEHWDGRGHPDGLRGDAIPLLARILGLSQTVEVFATSHGIDAAYDMAHARRGTWFDPELVDAMDAFRNDETFWRTFAREDISGAVTAFEPAEQTLAVDEPTLDRIAYGFAQVIDAKSPWTFRHSEGVSKIATGLATTMGMTANETRDIRRAGLLHDVGKLGVSNLILDKPAKLTAEETVLMRKHTGYTFHILQQVAGFRHLASLAAAHHERLDGTGYHRGLTASQLSTADRILAVADMFEALTAKRPYRPDLADDVVMDILNRNALSGGICPTVLDALKAYIANGGYQPAVVAA